MAAVASREQLKEYCLRALGAPVVEINVDEDQVEDRIDEAFQFYREFHYDAIELVYLKHEITANNISNQYIELNDAVVGVNRILPFSNRTTGMNMFDLRYQILVNDLYSLLSTDLIYYTQVKSHLELISQMLIGVKPVQFNRHMNRLYVNMNWQADVDSGTFLIVECYRILNPDTYTDVYNDRLLKELATVYIKRQWATNIKKFSGIQLPGGVTLNGDAMYQEVQIEIKEVEQELQNRFELPPDMFVG